MTEELIRQNAIAYLNKVSDEKFNPEHYNPSWDGLPDPFVGMDVEDAYVAGALSCLELVQDMKEQYDKVCRQRDELATVARILSEKIHEDENQWISVKDRLPEKTKGTFSCEIREDEADKILIYKDTRGYIHTGYLNKNGHWRDLDRDNAAIYEVTHWMPIKK